MEVPQKLRIKGIKFVLLEKGGKRPIQKEWQNKLIEYDSPELEQHLLLGGNYGVMGGGSQHLIIIDFDNQKVQDEVCKTLPKTFTVKSGSGKLHKYFFTDKTESFKIFDLEMNTLADIQGEGKQVVGAGSLHPNGNYYTIECDEEIAFLPYSEIQARLLPYDSKPKKEKKTYEKPKVELEDDFLEKIKASITIQNVLDSFGVDTTLNPTACPMHSSKGGKCLGYNGETAHCFHCDGSWNIFSFVKEMKKCDFKEALEYLANLSGLQNELEISRRKYIDKLKEKQKNEINNVKFKFLELVNGRVKQIGEATELIVKNILSKDYIYTTKDDVKSEMWIYKEGIYIPQGKSEIKERIRNILEEHFNVFYLNQVISKIEADTFIEQEKFFNQNYIDEIPVKNGILNLRTRELKPFSPEKIFFNKLPVEYDSRAECPQIDKFLGEVLKTEDDREVFYEYSGFCLWKEYKFEKALMMLGNGRNGKDKSLELIKRLLGIENCCSVPLASIIPDSFILSEFHNKMANLAGEISNAHFKDTTAFKGLTGRSLQSAPRKFLKPVTFVNHAKFIFACNELPMVYDNTKGFWDRWLLLDFPFTFVPKQEYDQATDKTLLKIRDESIIEKITTPQEMAGFLNKALEGLDRILEHRVFSVTAVSEEIKQTWVRKSNSVMAFCLANIEEDYENYVTKKEFRKRYTTFCKEHKISCKSDFVIKKTLEEAFGGSDGNREVFGKWEKVWEGIKWQ